MISWTYLRGHAGKECPALWADGRSEIVIERYQRTAQWVKVLDPCRERWDNRVYYHLACSITPIFRQAMKLCHILVAILLLAPLTAMALPSEPTDMISWKRINGGPGGGSEEITLWRDGRSEIVVQRSRRARKVNPGWTVTNDEAWSYYRKSNPLSKADAKNKFSEALTAGIDNLRQFTPKARVVDGGATSIRLRLHGKLKEMVLPMFLSEGAEDDKGSENHRRFLAIDAILGKFGTDAYEVTK